MNNTHRPKRFDAVKVALTKEHGATLDPQNLSKKLASILGLNITPASPQTQEKQNIQTLTSTTPSKSKVHLIQGTEGLAINRNSTRLYFQTWDRSISVMETESLEVVRRYAFGDYPTVEAFDLDDRFAFANDLRSSCLWVIDTVKEVVNPGANVESGGFDLILSPDAKHLYTCGGLNIGYLKIIDTLEQTVKKTLPIKAYPYALAANSDGSRVYVCCWDGESDNDPSHIEVIDTTSGDSVTSTPFYGVPYAMAVSPINHHIYIADLTGRSVQVFDTATNQITKTINIGEPVVDVCCSSDGKHLYAATYRSRVLVIDTENLEIIQKIDTEKNELREIRTRPDNGDLYVLFFK